MVDINPTIKVFEVRENQIVLTVKGINIMAVKGISPRSSVDVSSDDEELSLFIKERVKAWMRRNLDESLREDFEISNMSETVGSSRKGAAVKDFSVFLERN